MFKLPKLDDVVTDILIIGAGVSGITLAKKLKEKNYDFWILGSPFESQLAKAGKIKGSELLPEGTVGLKYMSKIADEFQNMGFNHKGSMVKEIEIGDKIIVKTRRQNFIPKILVIATGAKNKRIGFKGEEEFFGMGVSDCAICDFPLYRHKVTAVIGNHKYTIEAAELLNTVCYEVHLLWYKSNDEPQISPNIKLYMNVTDIEAYGNEVIEGVKIKYRDGEADIKLDGLFIEGEPEPNTEFLKTSKIALDENDYIIIDDEFNTNIDNVFAMGDVTGKTSKYDEAVKHGEMIFDYIVKKLQA